MVQAIKAPAALPVPVYYTRSPELAEKFEKNGWDPNGRSPFTNSEYQTLPSQKRTEVWQAIQEIPSNQVSRLTNRLNFFSRNAGAVGHGDFLNGDQRDFSAASGIRSTVNLVEPLFSRAIVPDDDDQSYVKRSDKLINEAEKFIFLRNFQFENLKRAKQLVDKAKEGVQVVLVAQPADQAVRPKQQKEFLDFLREAASEVPNLVVLESDIVPETAKQAFPQIMHVKSFIADAPDPSGNLVAEIHTDINEGTNSPNNFGVGQYTEGEAVLDSLQTFLSFLPRDAAYAIDTSQVPHVDDLRTAVKKKAKRTGRKLTPVEIGASGKRFATAPNHWDLKALTQRADAGARIDIGVHQLLEGLDELPKSWTANQVRSHGQRKEPIRLWASDAFKDRNFNEQDEGMMAALDKAASQGSRVELLVPPGISTRRSDKLRAAFEPLLAKKGVTLADVEPNAQVEGILGKALQNESMVRILTPEDASSEILNGFRKMFEDLKLGGADIRRANDVIRDESYRQMVYREMDKAIARKESIDVSAFALSDRNFVLKLIEAHQKGCPVRVVVDDLQIEESQINRKAWFPLARAGIPVKVLTDDVTRKIVDWSDRPDDVKAHNKFVVFGRERGDGKPPEPRVADGSANFSKAGFVRNVEGGRVTESAEVAQQYTERVMDRLWEVSVPVEGTTYVPDAKRANLIEPANVDTPTQDHVFVFFDVESMGLAPHLGDYPLTFSAAAYRLDENLQLQKVEGSDLDLTFDLPPDELGRFLEIPRSSYKIHGIDRKQGPDGKTITTQLTRDDRDRVSTEVLETVPLKAGLAQIRDYLQSIQKEHSSVVLGGQNINGYDLGVMDAVLGDGRFDVDGVHYKIDAPYVDTLSLSRRLFPDSRRHNLDALTQRLGLVEGARKEHTAAEDKRLTAEAFGALVRMEAMVFSLVDQGADGDWIGRLVSAMGGIQKFEQAEAQELEQGVVQWFTQEPKHLAGLDGISRDTVKELRSMHPEDRAQAVAVQPAVQALTKTLVPQVMQSRQATQKADMPLADVIPIDKMWFEPGDTVKVYADPKSMKKGALFKAEFDDDLRGRVKKPKEKKWGPSLPITEHRIAGMSMDGKAFKVDFTLGSGKSATTVEGWVPAKDIKIWEAGPNTYRLRDVGVHKVPVMQRKVRPYVGLGTARLDK